MKVGWGFIGASTIARQWMVDAVRAQPNHDVLALMSSSLERGRRYADQVAIPVVFDSIEQLLADPQIQVVYISTTNDLHKEQVLAAAAAGKHVLCEKPLALNVDDAVEMVVACQKAGVVMGTNHHLRNAATHQAIRNEIVSGSIGQVVAMRIFHAVKLPENLQTWRVNNPKAGGGVILDIGVHDADTVRFLLGEDPSEIIGYAQCSEMSSGVEDSAMTIMKMPSGAVVQAHESFIVPYAGTGLEIHGTKGSIFARDVMTQQPIGEVEVVTAEGKRVLDIEHHNLYEYSMSQFAKAIEGDGQAAVTGEDGVKSLAVALAAAKSVANGSRVSIEYPNV